ncbi:MAG TPA: DUF4365 domain-containing protein [Verrucomicrobiae bacterium]|jgi:hypothetical protein
MTPEEQKQQFSFAYARAVAAVARIAVDQPHVDNDSVDLTFRKRGGGGSVRSPQLDAQVKCTEAANIHQTDIAFVLKLKNYEDLRPTNLLVPRILVIVVVPEQLTDWVAHSEDELVMRKCGYWLSLRGAVATTNETSVTVHLPKENVFSVAQLSGIMQRIGNSQNP